MALTDENGTGMVMPVSPMYGNNNGGCGGFGNDWGWIILLLLFAGGGWGNGFGGYGGGQLGYDFPWLMNGQQGINNNVSDGFRDAQLHDSVTSIRDGISNLATQLCGCCGDIQTTLCNGFAGVNSGISNGFAQAEIAANGRQMANMNQAFAGQMAMNQGFNTLSSQLADCCCENRLATNDLKYTIATENCADRAALSDGIRDILAAQTAGIQSIKDQLCQDKIDAKNDTIAQLRQELLYARGQDSQDVQTSRILAGQNAQSDAIYNRFKDCPVPTMPVYGMTPIFTCNQQTGCGCGCNGGF